MTNVAPTSLLRKPGISEAELFKMYMAFGEDPFIIPFGDADAKGRFSCLGLCNGAQHIGDGQRCTVKQQPSATQWPCSRDAVTFRQNLKVEGCARQTVRRQAE